MRMILKKERSRICLRFLSCYCDRLQCEYGRILLSSVQHFYYVVSLLFFAAEIQVLFFHHLFGFLKIEGVKIAQLCKHVIMTKGDITTTI